MGAKNHSRGPAAARHRQSGQSMVEFAFLVPVVVGILFILIQVEMAISSAIVNQKFARQHLHFLFFNSRSYPELGFLSRSRGNHMRRFWIGVDADLLEANAVNKPPKAPVFKIGRIKPPEDDTPGEVTARQHVRVKVMAFTCVPPISFRLGEIFTENNLAENTYFSPGPAYCEAGD